MDGEVQTLVVSSAQFPHQDIEAFREVFGRAIMRLEIDPLEGYPLDIEMTVRALPNVGIAYGRLSPTRNTHPGELIDNDAPLLVIVKAGSGTLHQEGREGSVSTGEGILTSNGCAGTFLGHVPSKLLSVRLDRKLLEAQGVAVDDALIRPIASKNPALQLLGHYAGVLNSDVALATAELRHTVTTHIHDLAALVLGATRDGAELAKSRGVRAARLNAIKDDIIANLARSMTVDSIAATHGISASYVRKLFETDGTTFTDFILRHRLARAHRLLSDPRFASRKIGAIAFESGFGDLSYFNNAFRRRYGMTPTDVRTAAQQRN
ncbi:MAG TPA: AraC family transcriptional regulator [Pseudolabrys sp.]